MEEIERQISQYINNIIKSTNIIKKITNLDELNMINNTISLEIKFLSLLININYNLWKQINFIEKRVSEIIENKTNKLNESTKENIHKEERKVKHKSKKSKINL